MICVAILRRSSNRIQGQCKDSETLGLVGVINIMTGIYIEALGDAKGCVPNLNPHFLGQHIPFKVDIFSPNLQS